MHKITLPHHHTEGQSPEYLGEQLSKIDEFQTVAEIFKQLGDTTRVRIFWLLCHCEECVINISAMMEIDVYKRQEERHAHGADQAGRGPGAHAQNHLIRVLHVGHVGGQTGHQAR